MIQITSGTYGGKDGMKRSSDGPFSLSPAEEQRLVRRGVARYVLTSQEAAAAADEPVQEPPKEELPPPPGIPSHDELMGMTKAQIEGIAKNLGLDVRRCRNKSEMASLICEFGAIDDSDDIVL